MADGIIKTVVTAELKNFVLYCVFWLLIGLLCLVTGLLTSWYIPVILVSCLYWYSVMESSPSPDKIKKRKDKLVIIIGSGYSGLIAAIRLKQERIPFIIIEKSPNIGGTWWDNTYPGCRCDVASHLYSISFKPNPFWSRSFPDQKEILAYVEDTFEYFGINQHVKLNTKVERCKFNMVTKKWTVFLSNGQEMECNYLISGIGALNIPKYPSIPGRDDFEGKQFHANLWDHEFDWTDKRVGVIGSGCSAIQIVPSIAAGCKDLYVFQRTASWVAPKPDVPYPYFVQKCFQVFPFLMKLHRWFWFFRQELFFHVAFTKGSDSAKSIRQNVTHFMESQIDSEDLKKNVIPPYEVACKRTTMSNDYLPTLNRSNVHLVTDRIQSIEKDFIQLKNAEESSNSEKTIPLDAIIYATGFDLLSVFENIAVERPSDGKLLNEIWGSFPNAYLGIMQPHFPNLFFLLGPGTGLGHNSQIWMIECQVQYTIDAITKTIDQDLSSVEVKEEASTRYQQDYVGKKMKKRVFSSGCDSWYQNQSGENFALWPASCVEYWWKTLYVQSDDVIFS